MKRLVSSALAAALALCTGAAHAQSSPADADTTIPNPLRKGARYCFRGLAVEVEVQKDSVGPDPVEGLQGTRAGREPPDHLAAGLLEGRLLVHGQEDLVLHNGHLATRQRADAVQAGHVMFRSAGKSVHMTNPVIHKPVPTRRRVRG